MKRLFLVLAIFAYVASPIPSAAESKALKETLDRLAKFDGPFTFVAMGDSRSGERVHKKIVHQLMVRKPMFVVSAGDVLPRLNWRPAFAMFRNSSQDITVPYFVTPGNHDIEDFESEQLWREEMDLPGNETYYSFTVGKNLFVILNSNEPGRDRQVTGPQFEWLKKTLDSKKYEHQFVFVHHPVFMFKGATYDGKAQDRYPEFRDGLHDLFVEKKVTAVFSGHEHTFKRLEKDGVAYIITGGAGSRLYGKDSFNHFIVLRVNGARVDAKVIDREGVMRNEFVLQK